MGETTMKNKRRKPYGTKNIHKHDTEAMFAELRRIAEATKEADKKARKAIHKTKPGIGIPGN